jgi:hypothetical protein
MIGPPSEGFSMDNNQTEAMLERLADCMTILMQSSPDWRDQASSIVETMYQAGMEVQPEGDTPRAWCNSLFQEPGMSGLAETAIEMHMKPEEERRPIDLIEPLLPSDHHLD